MLFLDSEDIIEQLKKIQINNSLQILTKENIELIKNKIDLCPSKEFRQGKCLLNAFKVAETTNAKIVEGVAFITAEEGSEKSQTAIKHVWNILNNKYFDVTKDLVWPNVNTKVTRIDYFILNCYSLSDYNSEKDTIEFKSNADLVASSIRYNYSKKYVLEALESFGLSKKYHEQLLIECMNKLKI